MKVILSIGRAVLLLGGQSTSRAAKSCLTSSSSKGAMVISLTLRRERQSRIKRDAQFWDYRLHPTHRLLGQSLSKTSKSRKRKQLFRKRLELKKSSLLSQLSLQRKLRSFPECWGQRNRPSKTWALSSEPARGKHLQWSNLHQWSAVFHQQRREIFVKVRQKAVFTKRARGFRRNYLSSKKKMSKKRSLPWKKSRKSQSRKKLPRKLRLRHRRKKPKHLGLHQLREHQRHSGRERGLKHQSRPNRKSCLSALFPRPILQLSRPSPHLRNRLLEVNHLKSTPRALPKIHQLSKSTSRQDPLSKRTLAPKVRKRLP